MPPAPVADETVSCLDHVSPTTRTQLKLTVSSTRMILSRLTGAYPHAGTGSHSRTMWSSFMATHPSYSHATELEAMEAEAASWLANDIGAFGDTAYDLGEEQTSIQPLVSSAVPLRRGHTQDQAAAKEEEATQAHEMSNSTLDTMLNRLQGQLPPPIYERVIDLVRSVQTRRMSLSRSEFLRQFQAICAGGPSPGFHG